MSRFTDITFRPIGADWPSNRPRLSAHQQRRSPFRASWSVTIEELERELRMVRAERVVLQIDVEERDLRIDGKPRATARPATPATILSFDSRHGPVRMACDEFTNWQDNVRAIALSLKALRAVDRYGVTKRGEQYQGWRELEATAQTFADIEEWIEEEGGWAVAMKRYHPDNPETGDRAKFDQLIRYRDAQHGARQAVTV